MLKTSSKKENHSLSNADVIVIGGAVGIEKAGGQKVEVTTGRGDATQQYTDIDSFDLLKPRACGFRNYSEKEFDFRTACAVINNCDMYLGNEGGFGHAAAALNTKALIYFGGWISPQSTGYDIHENIYYDDDDNPSSPCGAIGYICDHCEKARQSIKVDYLEEKVKLILK